MIREVIVFLSAMGSGAAAGFIYDLIRLKRRAMRTKALLTGLEDIFFWVLTAVLVFITAYFSSYGEVRLYFLFAALLGVLIYYGLFSKWVIQILTFLVKAFLWPFAFLLRLLKPPTKWLCTAVGKGSEKVRKRLKTTRLRVNLRLKSIRHVMRKV